MARQHELLAKSKRHFPAATKLPNGRVRLVVVVVVVVVVVYIFRPVELKVRLPKGIGRPAACLAYLS
jgi:hypothetical protein